MAKREYREIDYLEAEEIRNDEEISSSNKFVDFDDFNNRLDEIEEELGEVIDLIEDDYDVKEALEVLKKLKDKLY